MKIERLNNKFEPVTLTLETQQDFDDFKIIMSVERDESLENYCDNDNNNITNSKKERICDFSSTIFDKIANIEVYNK